MKRVLLLAFILLYKVSFSQVKAEKEIIDKMIESCVQVKAASFLLISEERKKEGKTDRSEMLIKMKTDPTKIYVYSVTPNPGAEGLWRKGEMKDHVMINPNGFPFVTLKLDPYNSLLRKNSHHTINDIGFDYLVSLVYHYRKQLGEKFYSYLTIPDTVIWEGRSCIRLSFDYTDFSYNSYKVKSGESATTIGLRNYVNDYMIVCANKDMKDFHDVKANREILIPNMFARKIVFFVDRTTMLPLKQEIYDEAGLFERYEMKSFVLNPDFAEDEFSPNYKDYGF